MNSEMSLLLTILEAKSYENKNKPITFQELIDAIHEARALQDKLDKELIWPI